MLGPFSKLTFRLFAPVPRILKGRHLRMWFVAIGRPEKSVVTGLRIERRIKVDQIHAFRFDLVSEYFEVVPEVEAVRRGVVRRHRGLSFDEDLGLNLDPTFSTTAPWLSR